MNPVQKDAARVRAMKMIDDALDILVPLYYGDISGDEKLRTIFNVALEEAKEGYEMHLEMMD